MTSVVTTTTKTSDENKNNCGGESFKYQEIVGHNNHINIWESMIDIVKQINSISNLYRELSDFIDTNKSIWPTASAEEKNNLKYTRAQMKWQIDLQNCLETDIHFNDKGDTNQVYQGENITLKKKDAMVFRDKLVRFLYEKYKTKKNEVEEKINNLKGYLKNIFEKTFLVRDLKAIDKDQLARIATLAKLYPNFDHLMTIIGFKSKVISLYYLVLGDEQSSKKYSDFSAHIKQLPIKNKLTGMTINQHLIIPSKSILS